MTADHNSVFIQNSHKSVEALFKRMLEYHVDQSVAVPSGDIPVTAVGNRIKWTLNGFPSVDQVPFYVTVKKLVDTSDQEGPGDHFFSVVTMGGHPLKGYRFWRVYQASGGIVAETGAVDEPARLLGMIKRNRLGGNEAVLRLWKAQFLDILNFSSGDQGSGIFDQIAGGYANDKKNEYLRLCE